MPGESGIKRRLGRLGAPYYSGVVWYNPLLESVIRIPTRTINKEVLLNLPSKEGLTIKSEISILYRIKPEMSKQVIETIGLAYDQVITSVFRSSAADVTSKFYAKDMHSGERDKIEMDIARRMNDLLNPKGFEVESVLLKAIVLPDRISNAIEEKLKAEQDAQRMEFVKQKETLEADRLAIQAEGERAALVIQARGRKEIVELEAEGRGAAIRLEASAQAEANRMLGESISPLIIQKMQAEAFMKLAESNSNKIIISDGKTPLLGLPTTTD